MQFSYELKSMMGWGGAGRQAGATALPARRGARRWNRKEGPSVSDEPHKKVPVLAMNRTFVVHNICCTNTTAARRQSWRIRLHLSPHAMSMHSLAIHVIATGCRSAAARLQCILLPHPAAGICPTHPPSEATPESDTRRSTANHQRDCP